MHFVLNNGRPLGIIKLNRPSKGSKKAKQDILCIKDTDDNSIKPTLDYIKSSDFGKSISALQMDDVLKALRTSIPPKDLRTKELYNEAKKIIEKKMAKEFICENGTMLPVPNKDYRECIFVAAPSGSGKSTYVAMYAYNYNRMYPDNNIYLFSRLEEDKIMDSVPNLQRIVLTPEIEGYEVKANEFQNALVIFDDFDTIPNPKVKKFVKNLIDDLLQTGRHANTYIAVTSHLLYNSKETRVLLNELHSVTLFPGRSTAHSISYLLKKYFGLNDRQIRDICDLPSRWVTVYKSPLMVMYEKGAKFLDARNYR